MRSGIRLGESFVSYGICNIRWRLITFLERYQKLALFVVLLARLFLGLVFTPSENIQLDVASFPTVPALYAIHAVFIQALNALVLVSVSNEGLALDFSYNLFQSILRFTLLQRTSGSQQLSDVVPSQQHGDGSFTRGL